MSALLFNAVTFDPLTSLYTYNYIVQNTSSSNIGDFAILIAGEQLGIQPVIPQYTVPGNWTVFGSFSGSIAWPPYNENGGFYEFYAGGYGDTAIQPHTTMSGFSFVSHFAPTLDNGLNDYFLYGVGGEAGLGAVVGYGNTVVPSGADWMPYPVYVAAVPEPSTWLMLLIGFVALSAAGRRLTVQPAPAS